MFNYKSVRSGAKTIALAGLLIAGKMFSGCQKIVKGFLSDNIHYVENPLTTTQGQITVSSSIISDGSTSPLQVELVRVVDSSGKDVSSVLTKPDSITGFSDAVTYLDSTLDLLNKKIKTQAVPPLSVNSIGGRIQLTPATSYVPAGTYTIDVKVSNIRGSRVLTNACQIIIDSQSVVTSPDTVYSGTYAGTFDLNTGTSLSLIGAPSIKVDYYPLTSNKIVYKFIDKNGNVYDPKTNGILRRTNRWSMKQFDPYYPEVLTDTSVEYQFPKVPNVFPVFPNPALNGTVARGNYGVFPAIPAAHNSLGAPVYMFLDMAFYKQGTFVVTVTLSDVAWK